MWSSLALRIDEGEKPAARVSGDVTRLRVDLPLEELTVTQGDEGEVCCAGNFLECPGIAPGFPTAPAAPFLLQGPTCGPCRLCGTRGSQDTSPRSLPTEP